MQLSPDTIHTVDTTAPHSCLQTETTSH